MIFLLDTNICSADLRGHLGVGQKLRQCAGRVAISAICAGEFRALGLRKTAPAGRSTTIERIVSMFTLLPVDDAVSRRFAQLHAALLDLGRRLRRLTCTSLPRPSSMA